MATLDFTRDTAPKGESEHDFQADLRNVLDATGGAISGLGSQVEALVDHSQVLDTYFRVIVLGPVSSGKSSVIKRLVCHRFDNLPTYNSHFLGMKADGKHVMRTNMPAAHIVAGRKPTADDAARDVMLELQDRVAHASDYALLHAPTWYEHQPKRPASANGAAPKAVAGAAAAAAAAAAATATAAVGGSSARSAETTPSSDRRLAQLAAEEDAAAAAAAAAAGRLTVGKVRTGMPPVREPHPLMGHQIASKARETAARLKGSEGARADGRPNPLEQDHGARGWLLTFDLSSKNSFAEACAKVHTLMERLGYSAEARRPCPVAVMLVGNKLDLRAQRQVEPADAAEVLLRYVQQGALLPQLRKQRLASALLRAVDKVVHYKRSALAVQSDKSQPGRRTMGDEISVEMFKALQRLRNELDPLYVSASHCTDADAIRGTVCALRHCQLLHSELWEHILLCPALGLKYVEISCRTNQDVARMERMLLLTVRQLPSLAAIRDGGRGKKKGRKQERAQELLASVGLGNVGGLDFLFDAIACLGGGDRRGSVGGARRRSSVIKSAGGAATAANFLGRRDATTRAPGAEDDESDDGDESDDDDDDDDD